MAIWQQAVTFDDFCRDSDVDNGRVFPFCFDIMRHFTPLLFCLALSACGGGGGSSATAPAPSTPVSPAPPATTPAPAPAPTLTLSSPTLRTIAGGSAIPLTAKLSSGGAVRWQLAAGAPGALSAASGASVNYLPPAGTLAAPATVAVTASGDGASATLTLAVTPDPGAPGLYQLSWRPGRESEPTMLTPTSLATDLQGNVYVMLRVTNQSTSRRGPPQVVKIAADGSVTSLPGIDTEISTFDYTSGFAVDLAGNLLVGTGLALSENGSIIKITPAGVNSVVAGIRSGPFAPGSVTDGSGAAARFIEPNVVGIDIDDNLYVLDQGNVARKVTPAGVVTSPGALPAGLNADMNGNTYGFDASTGKLMRTGPDGVATVETRVPYCDSFVPAAPLTCLSGAVYAIRPLGGTSYVMIVDGTVRRLVLPH